MYALIGLGNPGKRYASTRHNIGYMIVDHFAACDPIPFKAGKGDYYYKQVQVAGQKVLVVKPTTFMNLSGHAVQHVLGYYNIDLEHVLVVCDDFNLPFGTLRYRARGSDGGHNGLRSIIYQLKSEDIFRLRFGIGDRFSDASSFVLDKFSKRELDELENLLPLCSTSIESWLQDGIDVTMNKYNRNLLD